MQLRVYGSTAVPPHAPVVEWRRWSISFDCVSTLDRYAYHLPQTIPPAKGRQQVPEGSPFREAIAVTWGIWADPSILEKYSFGRDTEKFPPLDSIVSATHL